VGGGSVDVVNGLLGLSDSYSEIILRDMERDQLVSREGSNVTLLPKGDFLLANLQQSETHEAEVNALWDMAGGKVISDYVDELMTRKEASANGLIQLLPKSMKPPKPEEIDVKSLQSNWASSRTRGQDDDEIIKVVDVRGGGRFRLRPGVALAYGSEDRRDVRAQISVGDVLRDDISQSFGRYGWAEQLLLRNLQGQKTTERALRARLFGSEGTGGPGGGAHLQLIQRRAVLRFHLGNLHVAQEAEPTEDRQQRLDKVAAELAEIEQRLTTVGASELLPFEVATSFVDALRVAKKRVWITTTLPIRRRLTDAALRELERALQSGIEVGIYIADRFRRDADEELPWHLRELNRLATAYAAFDVGFLADYSRVFYELVVDDNVLVVSNDPPLGERREADRFRAFAGLRLTSPQLIAEYRARFLVDDGLKIVDRFVVTKKKRTQKGEHRRTPSPLGKREM
jgi:hypothetical protein